MTRKRLADFYIYAIEAGEVLQAFAGEANVLVSEVAGIESTHG